MNPRQLLRNAAPLLGSAGIPDGMTDASLLLSAVTGKPALALRLDADTVLSGSELARFNVLFERRLSREPLQYILGEVSFYGRSFRVDPRVLIPRSETELLCEWALAELKGIPGPRILDLCCGSGCIGLTLKAERPDAAVTLTDISGDALTVAGENARALQLEAELLQGDLFSALPGRSFGLIVSNPPYIPSADCAELQEEVLREPMKALDGGEDGLDFYRRIVSEAAAHLDPGGLLLMEIGIGETDRILELLEQNCFVNLSIRKDYAGIDRMILGKRN